MAEIHGVAIKIPPKAGYNDSQVYLAIIENGLSAI
jgi:hypothetical protein